MKKIYFFFLFSFLIINAQEETSLNLKTLHQVNTFNGGEVFKTVFDDDQNNVTVGFANGEFIFGDENLSTTDTNTLFVYKSDNQTGQKIWIKTFTPSSKGSIKPYLVYSKNNQTYIVFNFKGSIALNGSTYNSNDKNWVIMKLDENGNILWSNSVAPMNLRKYFDVTIQNGNAFFLVNNKIFRFNDLTGELISSFNQSNLILTSLEVTDQSLYISGQVRNTDVTIGSELLLNNSAFILKSDLNFDVNSSIQFYDSLRLTTNTIVVDLEMMTDGSLSFVGLGGKKIKAYGENGIVADCNYNMTNDTANLFAGRVSADFTQSFWLAGNRNPYFAEGLNIKLFQLPDNNLQFYYSNSVQTGGESITFFNSSWEDYLFGSILLAYDDNGQPDESHIKFRGSRDARFDFKSINNKKFISDASINSTSVYELIHPSFFNKNFSKATNSKKRIISSNAFKATANGSFLNDITVKSELPNFFGTNISTPFSDLYSRIISKVSANGNLEWSSGFAGIDLIDTDLYYWNNNSSISENGETTVINKCSYNNNCYLYSNNTFEFLFDSRGKTFITNFNNQGSVNWMKTISGSIDSYSVYENKGASYATFHTSQSFKIDDVSYTVTDYTIVIIKISPLGQVEFVKLFQNDFYLVTPVILSFDENDNIYAFIEAYTTDQYKFENVVIPSNSQNSDYLMLKLDVNGTPEFGKNFYENLPDNYSSGWLSDVKYNGTDFIVYGTTSGNVTYFGFDGQIHTIPTDFLNAPAFNFISKVSKEGIVNWETAIFSKTFNYSKISLDNSANIYVQGFWTDKININNKNYSLTPNTISNNILKLNTLGDFKYIKEINSVPTIDVNSNKTAFTNLEISALPNGKIVIAGNTTSNNLLNGDINNLNGDNYYIAVLEEEVLKTEEVNKININIYPNPTSDFIHIDTKEKIDNIEVYDATGRKVISNISVDHQIDVRKLLQGIYYIRINTAGKNLTSKFIKK